MYTLNMENVQFH